VFHWTPTVFDLGLSRLDFTATDQLQQSASCGVQIRVSRPIPVFEAPSPCGQFLEAFAGQPLDFAVRASATNGDPGETVTLSVSGDLVVLKGYLIRVAYGSSQPRRLGSIGPRPRGRQHPENYNIEFTATDQMTAHASCTVAIRVHSSWVSTCQPGWEV
jgi:hypothetical protein